MIVDRKGNLVFEGVDYETAEFDVNEDNIDEMIEENFNLENITLVKEVMEHIESNPQGMDKYDFIRFLLSSDLTEYNFNKLQAYCKYYYPDMDVVKSLNNLAAVDMIYRISSDDDEDLKFYTGLWKAMMCGIKIDMVKVEAFLAAREYYSERASLKGGSAN